LRALELPGPTRAGPVFEYQYRLCDATPDSSGL
jgi:hypothetical protein